MKPLPPTFVYCNWLKVFLSLSLLLHESTSLNLPSAFDIEDIIDGEKQVESYPSYAPSTNLTCPANHYFASYNSTIVNNSTNVQSQYNYIRPAYTGLNSHEVDYINTLSSAPFHQDALLSFAHAANLSEEYAERIFGGADLRPNTAMAFSGGGYRAMLNGAAVFRAADTREGPLAHYQEGLSGLLQATNYLVGLSGGNWLVGATALNNFASVETLKTKRWYLEEGLITGVKGDPIDHAGSFLHFLDEIQLQVKQKADAGFPVTLTDYWSLALGRELVNHTSGGPNDLWSGISQQPAFKGHLMPFPISVSDSKMPDELIVVENSTIFESTPFEFGSWDRAIPMFFPMGILGTKMSEGRPTGGLHSCVRGFDVGAFVMGTSSSIFSGVLARLSNKVKSSGGKDPLGDLIHDVKAILLDALNAAAGGNEDVANYPNPFHKYNLPPHRSRSYQNFSFNQTSLYLADGGLDNQNIPFWPLLQKARKVDFILAVDSSADTHYHWPNGSSLMATQRRSRDLLKHSVNSIFNREWVVPFPIVPDDGKQWIEQGLNGRPVFFGCNGKNYTGYNGGGGGGGRSLDDSQIDDATREWYSTQVGPLILYLPNNPWTYYTNTSTFQLDYIPAEVDGFLANGERQGLQSNVLPPPTESNSGSYEVSEETKRWRTCLSCAIFQRSKERANIEIGEVCKSCFNEYCWGGGYSEDGSGYHGSRHENEMTDGNFDPRLKDGSGKSYESQHTKIQKERESMGVGMHVDVSDWE